MESFANNIFKQNGSLQILKTILQRKIKIASSVFFPVL